MQALLTVIQAVHTGDDGLTFAEVIANLPRDPASIFACVLLIVAVGAILRAGRPRRPRPPPAHPTS